MNMIKRVIACMVLCFMTLFLVVPVTGMAIEPSALDDNCQLAVDYKYSGTAIAGAEFHVYRVGELAVDGTLSLSGDFAEYPVEVNGLSSEALQNAANTLYDYALKDKLTPAHTLTTDEQGYVQIGGLKRGLYLVAGQSYVVGENEYVTEPQLVALPYKADVNSQPNYLVILIPKCSIKEEPEPLTLKVLKKWDDNGNTSSRPAVLTIYLLKDGEVYSTVKLTAEDNWRHEWTNLDPNAQWSVVEDVPEDYTVSISKEGITFVVTNTYDAPPPPSTEPPSKIPQTGLLWWPVPILAVLGLALIAAGIISRKGARDEA